MNRGSWAALGLSLALALACAMDAASEERAAPRPAAVSEPEPVTAKLNDVSAVADSGDKDKGTKSAQRLGLDLTSDAPLEIDARSAEMLEDGKGGESLRFRGEVKLTQGELKLTCDRLDAFFPEGRAGGRPQKVIASGDVQVVKGEFELRCTRATFEDASCIAVCLSSETCQSGKWPEKPARFRRGKDWIEGRELEFNQCTGKLFARCGARLQVAPKTETPKTETPKTEKQEQAEKDKTEKKSEKPAEKPTPPIESKP